MSEPELRLRLHQLADEAALHDSDSHDYQIREHAVSTAMDELVGYGPIGVLFRDAEISESEIAENSPLEQVCMKMVAKSPADRYPSMAAVAAAT